MAKNEPNKPDEVKTALAQEAIAEEKTTPAPMPEIVGKAPTPEKTAEETAALLHENGTALHESDKDRPEAPDPIDIPAPGDVVVSFDKINEIVSGKQAAVKEAEPADKTAKPEKTSPDKKNDSKFKSAEKADKKPSRPAKQEKAQKAVKPEKPKQTAEIGGGVSASTQATEQAQQKTPPPAPELPPEPKEAPRPGEQEQIVYLNLSELHAFKDHPFQVRNDEEMAAITYIKYGGKWFFLVCYLDLFNNEIVEWQLSDSLDNFFVIQSAKRLLEKAECTGYPILLHSDQGNQYTSAGYQALLRDYNATQSMSRAGTPRDNAVMESFFGRFKDVLRFQFRYWLSRDLYTVDYKANDYFNKIRPKSNQKGKPPVQIRNEKVA